MSGSSGAVTRSAGESGRFPLVAHVGTAYSSSRCLQRNARSPRELGVPVETGVFGARMEVELLNDGPVTIVLE
jgi:D-tyrosyl-tRNA(Tyr) deacylase